MSLGDRESSKVLLIQQIKGEEKVTDVTEYSKFDSVAGSLSIELNKKLDLLPGSYLVRLETSRVKMSRGIDLQRETMAMYLMSKMQRGTTHYSEGSIKVMADVELKSLRWELTGQALPSDDLFESESDSSISFPGSA